ncbi:GNAT family N-acetyltransferase [Croceimicrobium sp.]|uniref:GNAT family N-acetyltransferase n=1 Tax=Croceimicrobium sp. TaxID=2828340 RepID=UPI003BAC928E
MINSERCQFRLLSREDFPAILAMYAEPDSNKYIRPLREKSLEEYQVFLEAKVKNNQRGQGYFFSVFAAEAFIGTANFNYFEALKLEHVGVHLARAAWNKGYGTEILIRLKDLALEQGRNEIHALVEEGNKASISMLEKSGFDLKDRLYLKGDQLRIYKAILNEETI